MSHQHHVQLCSRGKAQSQREDWPVLRGTRAASSADLATGRHAHTACTRGSWCAPLLSLPCSVTAPTGRLTTPRCTAQGCRGGPTAPPLESGLADPRTRTSRACALGSNGRHEQTLSCSYAQAPPALWPSAHLASSPAPEEGPSWQALLQGQRELHLRC